MSHFDKVSFYPPDPIFGLLAEYREDKRENKVDLTVGVYRTENGGSYVFKAIQDVEKHFGDYEESKDYLPIPGDEKFRRKMSELLMGETVFSQVEDKLCAFQCAGGTSALRIGGELIAKEMNKKIHLSKPTWANHATIFKRAGLYTSEYRYFDRETSGLAFDEMCEDLRALDPGEVVLLHGCCHNPSGVDPTEEQWEKIAAIFKERGLLAFFDIAYQGFGVGLDEDAFPIRLFAQKGLEMMVAYSFSKNLGLYGERVGGLIIVSGSSKQKEVVESNVRNIIRGSISNPPRHGAILAAAVLEDSKLKKGWINELSEIRNRIVENRHMLSDQLATELPDEDWSMIIKQKGMFSMIPLTEQQVTQLKDEHALYITRKGRINVSSVTEKNLPLIIKAFKAVLK